MKDMKKFDVLEIKIVINCKKKLSVRPTLFFVELREIYPND